MPATGRADLDGVANARRRREPCGRCANPVEVDIHAVQQTVTAALSTIEPGETVYLDASKGFRLLES